MKVRTLVESLLFGEQSEKFSAWTVFEGEVEFGVSLEGRVNPNEKGVIDLGENVSFHHDLLDLVLLLYVFLLH